jgi:hypothetical protein
MVKQAPKRRRNRPSWSIVPRRTTAAVATTTTAVLLGLFCLSFTAWSQDTSSSLSASKQNDLTSSETPPGTPDRLRNGATPLSPNRRKEKNGANSPNPPSTTPKYEQQQRAATPTTSATAISAAEKQQQTEFMDWCQHVLGIDTILEIQTFEYQNYMQALPVDDDYDEFTATAVQDLPMLSVRGLAAARDITVGQVVIRIPLQALLTVSTTIDQDPVLTRFMGPEARSQHGWISDGTDQAVYLLEMPLLAVALLHHKKLGAASPLATYLRILESSSVDSMPFLWSNTKLKASASAGIRTVARGIQQEVQDMYDTVVQVLIRDHPDLFGPPPAVTDKQWMFSFENFQWAFAMVNSRHWQLPIEDLTPHTNKEGTQQPPPLSSDEQASPPADMPTDAWLQERGRADAPYNGNTQQKQQQRRVHSFLAPLADFLNFGPPCTTGRYNAESHTFEIVASCAFEKGQEVTFWYSDECDDIMAGSYGFTHPMVPPCPTAEEWRTTAEDWKQRAELAQEQLTEAYEDLDYIYAELQHAQEILNGCDCCRYDERQRKTRSDGEGKEPSFRLRHEPSVRGAGRASTANRDDTERHGVRRMWQDRNLEL